MSSRIERPVFYEGQILGAADLEAGSNYGRGQQARHNRYLHTWGIANGLELDPKGEKTADGKDFVRVTVKPGVAIDGTGREIVVPEPERLSDAEFIRLNILQEDGAWYPVYLIGEDETAPQPAFSIGACNNGQPTRKLEAYEITFGRPGDEQSLDEQREAAVSDGPLDRAWRVLLGFVQWDKTINNFIVARDDNTKGISRRYAGVQADEVNARGGTLTLRGRPRDQAGAPAVIIGEANGGELRFGLQDAKGNISDPPLFIVTSKGDLTAAGKITGSVQPGSVQLQSGAASDGTIIPLPPGITEKQVADDQVKLHIQITARIPGGFQPDNSPDWVAVPLECKLDASRRVFCLFRWFRLSTPATFQDLPGACNYTVVASVPAATGS
ncbi:MAG TPA: hypothetical protein VF131_26775 [Blastocatellia bacterium]|nr:hypothetical protein [Blastocatellia bacterium]